MATPELPEQGRKTTLTFTTCSVDIEQCFHCAVTGSPKLYWLFLVSLHSSLQACSFYRGVETFFEPFRNQETLEARWHIPGPRCDFAKLTLLNNSCCLICMMITHLRVFCKACGFANAWLALNTTRPCYC